MATTTSTPDFIRFFLLRYINGQLYEALCQLTLTSYIRERIAYEFLALQRYDQGFSKTGHEKESINALDSISRRASGMKKLILHHLN